MRAWRSRERGKDPRTSCQKDPSDSDLAWDSTLIFNSSRENEPLPTSKKVFRGEVFPSKSSHIFYRIKNSRFCRRWKESYHFLPWSVGSRIKSGLTHTHFFVEEISKPDGFLSAMMIQLAGQELIYLQFRFLHRKIRGITISLFSLSLSLILVVKVVLQSGVQQIRTLAARCKWQGLIKARYKRDESERIENKKEVSFYDASFACLMRARALQNLGAINYAQSLYLSHFSLRDCTHTHARTCAYKKRSPGLVHKHKWAGSIRKFSLLCHTSTLGWIFMSRANALFHEKNVLKNSWFRWNSPLLLSERSRQP